MSSTLAVGLVAAPFVVGGALAFPIWDDGQLWLMMKEKGPDFIVASFTDRPVNARLWALLATSESMFWAAPLVAQAVLWSALAWVSARLWAYLFPNLAGYAWVVAVLSISPMLTKVQTVLATVVLAALLPVVLAYVALLLVHRYVARTDHPGMLGRGALPLSAAALGTGILLQEYAVPVALITIVLLLPHLWRPADAAARRRALNAVVTVAVTMAIAYAAYRVLADPVARGNVDPALMISPKRLVLMPFLLTMAVWRGVVVNMATALADAAASLSVLWPDAPRPQISTVVRAAYGVLVAGLLVVGARRTSKRPPIEFEQNGGSDWARLFIVLAALVAGLFPIVAMGRVPWDPGDALTSRFGLPVLPIVAALILRLMLGIVAPRLWVVPVILVGFTAGSMTVGDVWEAIRERQTLARMGAALEPRVAAVPDLSVAVVALPERALGPRRQWELTARLAATWPAQLRERFWAYRIGGGRPLFYPEDARLVFGSREACRAPKTVSAGVRLLQREGELGQLLFVAPGVNGAVVIEPYCLRDG